MNRNLKITANFAGQRLDVVLANLLAIPRGQSQRLIKKGLAKSESGEILKSHTSVKTGQIIVLAEADNAEIVLPLIQLDVIYEDQVIIVINKRAGQIVHPGVGQSSESIAEALYRQNPAIEQARYNDSNLSFMRAGIVHRLDKDTSGVMIVAKTYESLINLQQQFKNRTVKKEYRALVYGDCPDQVVEQPLGRHPKYRRKQAVVTGELGRPAVTQLKRLKLGTVNNWPITYLSCQPQSGRMHQIRVHLQHLNHCILGDPLYNTKKSRQASFALAVPRLMLHAYRITIKHPQTNKSIKFIAPLPKDLSTLKGMI